MPVKKLKEYLDREKVKYVTIRHSEAFTAQEIAAAAHIPGKELAKTVVVNLDDRMALAVLPSSRRVDLESLRSVAGASRAELATESQFKDRFPDCDLGAMPPFGNLYEMDVFVTESLAQDEEIVFNACSHTELVRLAYKDFARLVKPTVAHFSAKG